MGVGLSLPYEIKAIFERKLSDQRRQLTRVLSKSNSMQSLDKEEVKELKTSIRETESVLSVITHTTEDERAPSF
jgi:hypothetical protein